MAAKRNKTLTRAGSSNEGVECNVHCSSSINDRYGFIGPAPVHVRRIFPVSSRKPVPFATRNFLRVCYHRASLSAASTSPGAYPKLAMLNRGVLFETKRCRPGRWDGTTSGFFFAGSMAPGIEISPNGGGEHGKLHRRCSGVDNTRRSRSGSS